MPTFPTADPAVLDRLRHYDSPTICNVLELFDIRPRTAGYLDGRIRACFSGMAPMVGYASTATFRASSPPRSGDVYAGLAKQVELIAESPGPAVAVFQDLDDPCVAATFGEVMCTTYKAFGAAGLITSGAGRDLDQVEALGFPCFTNGAICSHGYSQIVQLDVPVRVGGVTINPGDLLHGDRNGVTTIPTELAAAVADACPELMEAEAVVLDYLKAGKPDPKGYAAARAECHRRLGELSARLRQRLR
jgi:4-hydroxy-4-methyl-2-oxoglutarate aldolase